MKKKLPWIVGGIVVIVGIIILAIFALGGKDAVPQNTVNIVGTWKVAAYVNNGSATIVDNEFMVFDNETAKDYRDDAQEPFVVSKYELKDLDITLTDINRLYSIEQHTDNYIRLYESDKVYMELIRWKNADMSVVTIDPDAITGKWEIVFRNTDQVYAGDCLQFENGTIGQVKAGASEAVASAPYEIKDGHLIVSGWGKDMVIYPLTDDTFLMVEIATDTGFIWELHRAK